MLHKMNIKKIYLDNINAGLKTHEYRLANEKRLAIRLGDEIELTASETLETTIVKVIGMKIYPDWKSALTSTPNFMEDFKDLYKDLDEVLANVTSFYTKDAIDKYGIVVFDIEKI